jgi:hypothetical protein
MKATVYKLHKLRTKGWRATWDFRWLMFLFGFCFSGRQRWRLGCRAGQRPSVIERRVCVLTSELEFQPERDMIRFVLCKDCAAIWRRNWSRQEWLLKTDQLAGLTQPREIWGDLWKGISYANPYAKILPLQFRILEWRFQCKFHSAYISICVQIFKTSAYVNPICFRSIWKILAEKADTFFNTRELLILHIICCIWRVIQFL